jgi:hypothetical protein
MPEPTGRFAAPSVPPIRWTGHSSAVRLEARGRAEDHCSAGHRRVRRTDHHGTVSQAIGRGRGLPEGLGTTLYIASRTGELRSHWRRPVRGAAHTPEAAECANCLPFRTGVVGCMGARRQGHARRKGKPTVDAICPRPRKGGATNSGEVVSGASLDTPARTDPLRNLPGRWSTRSAEAPASG